MSAREFYDLKAASEQFSVSVRTLQAEVKAGRLPVYKPTDKPLIRHQDLVEWAMTDRPAS